jgi:hypothetical protein
VTGVTGRAPPGVAYFKDGVENPVVGRGRGVSPEDGRARPKFGRIDPFCMMAVLPVLFVAALIATTVSVPLGLVGVLVAGLIVLFDSWANRPAAAPPPPPPPARPAPARPARAAPARAGDPRRAPARRPPPPGPRPEYRVRQAPPGPSQR